MTYPVPYLILVALLEVCALIVAAPSASGRTRLLSTVVAVASFFLFFAFRGFIMSDWIVYYPYFVHCSWSDIYTYTIGSVVAFEPGYTILNLVCRSVFDDYFFFQFVVCLIDTVLLLRFFRQRVDNIPLALTLFVVFSGLSIICNLMRNFIAILLFLNALPYLEERRPLPYFLMCLLAATFHMTALVYMPLYFILHRSFSKWIYLGVFIACNVVFLGKISLVMALVSYSGLDEQMSEKVRVYTELFSNASVLSIGYLERLATGLLVFCYYDRLREINPRNSVIINALLLYFMAFFLFSEFETLSQRSGYLFVFSYWVIWIDLMKCFAIANNRKLFVSFVMFYCLLKTWSMTQLPDMQYDNVLTGMKSYQERLVIHNKTTND